MKKDRNHPEVVQTYILFAAQKKISKNLNDPDCQLLIKQTHYQENFSIFLLPLCLVIPAKVTAKPPGIRLRPSKVAILKIYLRSLKWKLQQRNSQHFIPMLFIGWV
jgi:hypothetical protein